MAYFSVFVFTSLLLNLIIQKLKPVFHSLSKIEITVYLVIAVLIIAFVCCVYMRTRLFYEAHDTCDLVYVFDTPDLMDPNAIVDKFVREWCKYDDTKSIRSFQQFVKDGERWGWD